MPDAETRQFVAADLPTTDVLVLEVDSAELAEEVDQFTIALTATDSGADMCLRWITTEVCLPIAQP